VKRMGVLLELLRWCEKRWTHIAPSQEWLAAKLKWTLRTLQRTVAALKKAGLLLVIPRYKRSALYKLVHMRVNPQMSFEFAGLLGDQQLPLIPFVDALPVACAKPAYASGRDGCARAESRRSETVPEARPISRSGGPDGGAEFKTSLRLVRREVSVPLVIFLKPVHARKPPRRQTALERASERFLREG
jgi:hypothetical protein